MNQSIRQPSRVAMHLAFVALAITASLLAAEPKPAWTPEKMLDIPRVGSVQVSPDGKLVAFTVRRAVMDDDTSEYVTHIHLATADGQRSWQLTQGEKSCDDPQWSPDGKTIAFVSKRGGKKDLWLIRPDGGEAQRLTELKSDVSSFQWSPDGGWLAFSALDPLTPGEETDNREKNDARVIDEDVKRQRLHVVAAAWPPKLDDDPKVLTPADISVASEGARAGRAPFDWSPDGRTIVLAHVRTPQADDWTTADVSLVDVATGKLRPLATTEAAETSPLFSPDGKSIAFVASDVPPTWASRRRVHVVAASGGTPRELADTADGFGRYSELVGWSTDASRIYFTELQGTNLRVLAMPLTGSPTEISKLPGMSLGGVFLNARRTMLGFSWETLSQPSEAFASAVDRFEPVKVSRLQDDTASLPRPRTDVVRWKSTDDFEIEGLLTYPLGYEQGKRYPLLVIVHGGPMGAFTQSFDGSAGSYPVAAFAARGYALLRPNVRGSSGYGAKFRYANYGDWGGGDFRDLMSGVDRAIALGLADPDRLGIMGWSYGGFMTSWTITQTQRFKAASVGAGVTNLVSFTGTADIPGFLPDYFGGEFWDKLDPYRDHSAMFHVKGVRTPTLIQHGERDERVPLSQGQELYNALKRQGCTTKMVVYPRTPHGIEEPRLLLDCMQRNLAWFDQYIGHAKPTTAH